jgi:hypothetical protein
MRSGSRTPHNKNEVYQIPHKNRRKPKREQAVEAQDYKQDSIVFFYKKAEEYQTRDKAESNQAAKGGNSEFPLSCQNAEIQTDARQAIADGSDQSKHRVKHAVSELLNIVAANVCQGHRETQNHGAEFDAERYVTKKAWFHLRLPNTCRVQIVMQEVGVDPVQSVAFFMRAALRRDRRNLSKIPLPQAGIPH